MFKYENMESICSLISPSDSTNGEMEKDQNDIKEDKKPERKEAEFEEERRNQSSLESNTVCPQPLNVKD